MAYLILSQKERIVTRHCDGISVAQIAIDENILERTARRAYQQWKKNGTVDRLSSTMGKESWEE